MATDTEASSILDGIEGFEWNEQKAKANLLKHDIDFEEASEVFYATPIVKRSDRYGEIRWTAIGLMANRVITIVFARRGNAIRIISARRARRNEERTYREKEMGRPPQGKDGLGGT